MKVHIQLDGEKVVGGDISFITNNQEHISILERLSHLGLDLGFNPLNYESISS